MAAYRRSAQRNEHHHSCGECTELADASCPRCSQPTCSHHLQCGTRRCFNCELHYLKVHSVVTRAIVIPMVIVGCILGLFGALTTHAARNGALHGSNIHLVPILVPIAVALLACGFMAPIVITRLMRARFLHQRAAVHVDCEVIAK